MSSKEQNYIMIGEPGSGKSWLLSMFVNWLKENNLESRLNGVIVRDLQNEEKKRYGFEMIFFPSKNTIRLSTKGDEKSHVGNYTVHSQAIDCLETCLQYLTSNEVKLDIIIFDEIGKMQQAIFPKFTYYLDLLLKKEKTLFIGTIVKDDVEWARKYKTGEFANLLELTREKQKEILSFLQNKIL